MRARVFAVMALAALPLGALSVTAEAQGRFRAVDRNGDGFISPAEWRGSAREFRSHDLNGDGRLSEAELRRTMNADDDIDQNRPEFDDWTVEGFRYVDRNRDGRITRLEWAYDLQSFRRADVNGDNILSRAEFLAIETPRDEPFETQREEREERFETLDSNNDGRITRGEWRGRSQRFEALDRNNDGIVTRSEMLPAGDDSESRVFMDADLNRDNRLSQREWQWSQRVFTNQDTNRDGFVSREEFWSPGEAVTGTTGYADNRTVNSPVVIQVDPTQRWVDTGLDTRAGDVLRITSSGRVTLSRNGNDDANPAGANRRAEQAPLPFYPAGALIARISNGQPFFIGDGTNLDRVNAAGRLYLGVNDDHLADNSGSFRVTITIRPQ